MNKMYASRFLFLALLCASALSLVFAKPHKHNHHETAFAAPPPGLIPPPMYWEGIPQPPFGVPPMFGAQAPPTTSPMDSMRFMQTQAGAGASSTATTTTSTSTTSPNQIGDDTDRDFVRSIYNLLSRSRDANVHDNTMLEQQRVETEKKEQELNRRADILKARAAMLTRLQYCLERDAPSNAQASTTATNTTTVSVNNKDIAARLARLERELDARKTQLEAMARELAAREKALQDRIAAIQEREKELLQMKSDMSTLKCPCLTNDISDPPSRPVIHPSASERVAQSSQLPCPPPPPCACNAPDMPRIPPIPGVVSPAGFRFAEAGTEAEAGAGASVETESEVEDQSAIAISSQSTSKSKSKALSKTSVSATEKAAAEAAAAAGISVHLTELERQMIAAYNASIYQATQPSTTTCPHLCSLYRACGLCVADPNCGWCSSSKQCLSVEEGKSKCDAADYSIMYCREHTCEEHTYCRSCMADPKCGMCSSTGKCTRGSILGPAEGTCNSWSYATGLRFLSFNIYGRDTANCTARAQVIFKMLERANADFVALQEVEDWFLELLAREKWAANYHISDFGSGHAPGGLLIMSKVPLTDVAYYEKTEPGQVEVDQRGRLLVAHPKMGRTNFAIASTTLDWRSGENRADSMTFLFSVLNVTTDVVLMGDFNFDTNSQPETAAIPFNYEDVWQSLRPNHLGYTWDPKANSYARISDPNSRPSRLDRILVKSGFWEARKIQKIGSPEASPHYGLLAQLEMFGAYC